MVLLTSAQMLVLLLVNVTLRVYFLIVAGAQVVLKLHPGGFKATPGSANVFAHTIAKNEPHQINSAFNLDRFASGIAAREINRNFQMEERRM